MVPAPASCWGSAPYRRHRAVVNGLIREEDGILDEHGSPAKYEGCEEVDVDGVSGAMQLPTGERCSVLREEKREQMGREASPLGATSLGGPQPGGPCVGDGQA